MENKIDITGVDLNAFVKAVYELSVPIGLGFLHATEGPLSDADANMIATGGDGRFAVRMDYVHGRQCKMNVIRDNDKLWIDDKWFDHTPAQLTKLLDMVGVKVPA